MSDEEEDYQQQIVPHTRNIYDDEDDEFLPAADEQMYKCTRCNTLNAGYEEKEASLLTYISAILALLIFRLFAVMILPLLIESTKTILKKCNKCENVLVKQELLSIPSLTDKILSFKCGNCMVVISRKYAIVLLAIIALMYFIVPTPSYATPQGGMVLNGLKWETYVNDCGKNAVMNNGVRAKRNYDQKYFNNIVEWSGVLTNKADQNRMHFSDSHLFSILHIKMIPSEAIRDLPDIMLLASHAMPDNEKQTIKDAKIGTVVKFNASFQHLGNEFDYHKMNLLNFEADNSQTVDPLEIKQIDLTTISAPSSFRAPKYNEDDSA